MCRIDGVWRRRDRTYITASSSLIVCRPLTCFGTFIAAVLLVYPRTALSQNITLTLEGTTDGGDVTLLTNTGAGIGDLGFGSVDTVGLRTPMTGARFRLSSGGPGAFFTGTIRATVTHDGVTATLALQRTVQGSVGPTDLRYALGISVPWTSADNGTVVPRVGSAILSSDLLSGENVVHQIAVLVMDTDPVGPQTTTIMYTATVN